MDCLTLWLTRTMDAHDAWSDDAWAGPAAAAVAADVEALVAAVAGAARDVVLVTNEVGQGVVPATASGRRFRDEMGVLNAPGGRGLRGRPVVRGRPGGPPVNSLRLMLGTLTVLRVPPPTSVDRRTAGGAMLLAPLGGLLLAVPLVLLSAAERLDAAAGRR